VEQFIGMVKEHFYTIDFGLLQNVETSTGESSSSSSVSPGQSQLELSFEYLMSKDKLQWITIASEQAILMSVCLQAMVDELLLKKTGMKRKQVCC
jgi:sorting nexin-17